MIGNNTDVRVYGEVGLSSSGFASRAEIGGAFGPAMVSFRHASQRPPRMRSWM